MIDPTQVVILFGGTSEERRVSVATAQNVSQTLGPTRLWFQHPEGSIYESSQNELLAHSDPFQTDFSLKGGRLHASLAKALDESRHRDCVFFLALHGGSGEDGTLQKEFEIRGIPFTGSGSEASAAAFDKRAAKKKARERGVRVCPDAEISGEKEKEAQQILSSMFTSHRELMVKPVAGGSSIGLFHIKAVSEMARVLDALRSHPSHPYLVEPFVGGKELTVGVYEKSGKRLALPPTEIRLLAENDFDYEGKYLGRNTEEITPARISEESTVLAQTIALTMHRALGCEGYSRTDLILSPQGPVYLETNTLPGLTRSSFIPQQLAVAKISFKDFLLGQLEMAVERGRPQ